MSSKDEVTWYVVADGGKARILLREGEAMRTLSAFDSAGHGDTGEDDAAAISQLKAPHADPHGQVRALFARQVAEHLNVAANAHRMTRVVLAAPGHVLHDIKAALGKPATHMLAGSLSKDLTNIAEKDLWSHLATAG